jgi:hypothetical protein
VAAPDAIALSDVFRMLESCAPGHEVKLKLHHYWVIFRGRTFTSLPKGPGAGGARSLRTPVHAQVVRKLVRHLEIDPACAAEAIPALGM